MTEKQPLNVIRCLSGIIAGAAIVFGIAAAYVAMFPMAFLPSGYPVWVAKQQMLHTCDLGEVMQFGDSQLEAGIVSYGLPLVSTNFSAGGVSPLDSYFLVRQALACPDYPKHAILSFGVGGFLEIQEAFWGNIIRFDILGVRAVADIENSARHLHDPSFDDYITFDGLSGWNRDFLYLHHFPPLYFDSLVSGGLFLRETSNSALFADALVRRGQMPYRGVQAAPPASRNQPPPPGFHPLPIQVEFFERMVSALETAGVSIDFIMMPLPQARAHDLLTDRRQDDFINYLREVERRHPKFHLINSTAPVWPDRDFIDEIHLNPEGASRFTTLLNDCLRMSDADWKSGTYSRACDFARPQEVLHVGLSDTQ